VIVDEGTCHNLVRVDSAGCGYFELPVTRKIARPAIQPSADGVIVGTFNPAHRHTARLALVPEASGRALYM